MSRHSKIAAAALALILTVMSAGSCAPVGRQDRTGVLNNTDGGSTSGGGGEDPAVTARYDAAKAVFQNRCDGCHGVGTSNPFPTTQAGFLTSTNYNVVPKDSIGSRFFQSLKGAGVRSQHTPFPGESMPMFAPAIPGAEIDLISEWIAGIPTQ
jgi:hypothetical protein